MATITTRSGKGSRLTSNEVDANFMALNTELSTLSASGNSMEGGGHMTGALQIGDTPAELNLLTLNGGHIGDAGNDYGLTINSYEPGIALVDRSTGAGSAMLHSGHDGELVILTDTTNDGTIGHDSNTTDATMAHFSRDFVALWTTYSGTPEERLRITNYGRVGIGTASPSTLLHLSDNNPIITLTDENTGVDHLLSGSSSSGAFLLHVDANYEHGSAALFLKVRNTNAITAKADGKIGFGLIDPANELQINTPDAGTGSDAFIRVGLNASYASLLVGYAGAGDPADEAPAVYASNTTGTTGGAGNLVLKARGGTTVRDIVFHAGTTSDEVMRLTSAGSLGIGTDSPSAPLHVHSSAPSVMLSDSDGTNQYGIIEQAGGSLILQSRNNTYIGAVVFRGQSDSGVLEYGRFSAGRFGIAETSPQAYLHVSAQRNGYTARFDRGGSQLIDFVQDGSHNSIRSTGQTFAIGTIDTNDTQFKWSGMTRMALTSAGLDMQGNTVYNTVAPVSDDELANKGYVDSVFAGGNGDAPALGLHDLNDAALAGQTVSVNGTQLQGESLNWPKLFNMDTGYQLGDTDAVWWNVTTFGGATRLTQVANFGFLPDSRAGRTYTRTLHDSTWSGWYESVRSYELVPVINAVIANKPVAPVQHIALHWAGTATCSSDDTLQSVLNPDFGPFSGNMNNQVTLAEGTNSLAPVTATVPVTLPGRLTKMTLNYNGASFGDIVVSLWKIVRNGGYSATYTKLLETPVLGYVNGVVNQTYFFTSPDHTVTQWEELFIAVRTDSAGLTMYPKFMSIVVYQELS